MKTVIAVAVTALIMGASSTFATTQFIDRGARAQAHAALVQAKQAKASVRALNVRVQDLEIANACMKDVVPVSLYYTPVLDWAGLPYYLNYIDTTHSGSSVSYYVQTVDAGCLVTGQSFHTSKAPARVKP